MVESIAREEVLALLVDLVRQQRNAFEIFLLREINHVVQQQAAIPLTAMFRADNYILHQDDKSAFRRANGEQEIHHAHEFVIVAHNEDTSPAWLLQNQFQSVTLFLTIRLEIFLNGKQRHDQVSEFREVFNRRRFHTGSAWGGMSQSFHGWEE